MEYMLSQIIDSENKYGQIIESQYGDYHYLQKIFLSFFAKSLIHASGQTNLTADKNMHWMLFQQTINFRLLRAAEVLLYSGYPLSALHLLRDLKNHAASMCAILSGLTTPEKVIGATQHTSDANNVTVKTIMKCQQKE